MEQLEHETGKSIFYRQLAVDNEENAAKRGNRIGLSQLGKCPRQSMLGYLEHKPLPFTEFELATFEHGRIIEHTYCDKIEKAGRAIKRNVAVELNGIQGEYDLIESIGGVNTLCDVKSIKAGGVAYKKDKDGKWDLNTFMDYVYQLTAYYYSIEKGGTEPLCKQYKLNSLVDVVWISKNDLLIDECLFDPAPHRDAVLGKINMLKGYMESKQLPPERDIDVTNPRSFYPCFGMQNIVGEGKKLKMWCKYMIHCPKMMELYNKMLVETPVIKTTKRRVYAR